jgi:hypothetical protein
MENETMFEALLALPVEEIAEIASENTNDGQAHAPYVIEIARAIIAMGND